MVKKVLKKETKKKPSRDQYTVVLEDIRDNFKVFGEVLGDVNEKVTGHTIELKSIDGRLGGVENRLDGVENKLDDVENKLDGVENRLGGVENRLDNVENRLDNVETDLGVIRNELAIIRHNQVTRDEFKLLETRVSRLEKTRA